MQESDTYLAILAADRDKGCICPAPLAPVFRLLLIGAAAAPTVRSQITEAMKTHVLGQVTWHT